MDGTEETRQFRINLAKIKVEPIREEPVEVKAETKEDICSVCWCEPPVNAVRLECNHIFCFLCIKSVALATGRCALCRSEINADFEHGHLDVEGEAKLPSPSDDGYFWFYEGKTGWWLYDAETNRELEQAYENEDKLIEKLIAGQVYVISLRKLKQYQKSDRSRTRKICRDTLELENILGIAGLRDRKLLEQLRRQHTRQPEFRL